jgi:hypothetical protein
MVKHEHAHPKKRENHRTQMRSLDGRRKAGWAMYYSSERDLWKLMAMMKQVTETQAIKDAIPKHIADGYIELVTKYDADKRSCPICLEDITFETSLLTACGHLFHRACIEGKVESCPVCRGKYAPKAK